MEARLRGKGIWEFLSHLVFWVVMFNEVEKKLGVLNKQRTTPILLFYVRDGKTLSPFGFSWLGSAYLHTAPREGGRAARCRPQVEVGICGDEGSSGDRNAGERNMIEISKSQTSFRFNICQKILIAGNVW